VTVHIGGVDIDLIPWINEENYTSVMEFVENSCSKLAFAHLELQDFQMHLGSVVSKGMSPDIFEKYYAVYTGHYHHKSSRKNINYLGAPYEMTWADEGDDRGFHLVDLDTCTLEYVKNPYKMFNKVFYDDTVGDYDEFDVDQYQGKIVKLIVSNKTKPEMYEKFIRRLEMVNTCDLQLIDEVAVSYDTDISVDLNKDTLNLLLECVDGNADMPDEYDNAVKNVLTSVYMETSDNG
jgi:DNA repair exonuclease SbcCD nuclease subunit